MRSLKNSLSKNYETCKKLLVAKWPENLRNFLPAPDLSFQQKTHVFIKTPMNKENLNNKEKLMWEKNNTFRDNKLFFGALFEVQKFKGHTCTCYNMCGQPFFLYGPNFAFFESPRSMKRRRVENIVHILLQDMSRYPKSFQKHLYHYFWNTGLSGDVYFPYI